jgi:glycerol-3-phosphate dehydrogenase
MRPLRGSHIAFPQSRFPLDQAIAIQHPIDHRVMFVFPWQGVSVVGTTDIDHAGDLDTEPGISPEEVAYLMAAVELRFPELKLGLDDVVSTWSGVRPVVHSGAVDPSAETRDHVVWEEQGLVTVTGGKLTTFRIIARDALKTVSRVLGRDAVPRETEVLLDEVPEGLEMPEDLEEPERRWLVGRYGALAKALVDAAGPGELEHIEGSPFLWAELRHAARHEWVEHLDDLLLRRLRLGLVLPRGGIPLLARVREIVQVELGWSDARWEREQADYIALWRRCYSLPEAATIPDWREMARKAREAA